MVNGYNGQKDKHLLLEIKVTFHTSNSCDCLQLKDKNVYQRENSF